MASATPAYTIVDLGTLSGPQGGNAWAHAINASGNVAGYSAKPSGNTSAFLYQNGNIRDLGSLVGYDYLSIAHGISNSGKVAGASYKIVGNFAFQRAFLFNGFTSPLVDLGTLGGPRSEARAVNTAGRVVGFSTTTFGANHAFLHSNGQMSDLGTLGGANSYAHAINDSGLIVGEAETGAGESHAFLYVNGQMRDLGTLGGPHSAAFGISAMGTIAGYSFTPVGNYHAVMVRNGRMIDLGTLGGDNSQALAVNDSGQAVGWSDTRDGYQHAFLYDNGTMIDLNNLLESKGWTSVYTANGINNRGQITGIGFHDGGVHSFVLTPIATRPPVTTIRLTGQSGANGWFVGPVQVTLSASDPDSDLAATYFTLNGGATQTYRVPLTLANEGTHQLTFWSVDRAGNREVQKSQTIKIDAKAPTIDVLASPDLLWPPTNKMVTVTLMGSIKDGISGVNPATARYSVIDEYGRVQPTGTINLTPDGRFSTTLNLQAQRNAQDRDGRIYSIQISATDKAGNNASTTVRVTVPHDQR